MKLRNILKSIQLFQNSAIKEFQGLSKNVIITIFRKKNILTITLCASTINLFAQQNIQTDTSIIESICKQLTNTTSKNLIIFNDFAEYNIVFVGDKTVSHDIKVSNIKTNAIQYYSFIGNQLTLSLPLHQSFKISDIKCDNDVIETVKTEYINPNIPLEVSKELMNALSLDDDFKSKRITLFDLLNKHPDINYYEKLKFLQVHILKNKPISYQFNIHPSNYIDSSCNGGIKFNIDSLNIESPIDGPIFDANPESVACKATLTLRNSSDFKNDLIKVKIPYDHYISSGTYNYSNPGQSSSYHTEFHENTKGIAFTKRISNEDWYQNAFVSSLGPTSLEITNMNINNTSNSSDNMSYIDLNLVVTNGDWFQSECGCEKQIISRLRYDCYHEIYTSDKGINGSAAKSQTEEISSAQIIDINTGVITPIITNYLQVSNSCATSLNPAFITQLNQVATSLISVGLSVAAAAISGGSTAVINAIAANNSTSSLVTGLIGLFTTNSHLYQGVCGTQIHNPVAFDNFYNFTIQPNSRKIISLSSMQRLYVEGQKKWKSQAVISGGGYISLFIKPNGTKTGIWKDEVDCCSPQAGIWMQASMDPIKESQYLTAVSNEMYMNNIVGWLPQYTSGTYVNTYGNYSLILGNTPSDCKKPILFERHANTKEQQQASCNWSDNILYITSKNKIGAAYEVYDIGGKLLKTGIIESDQQFAFETATKTMYIIKIISNNTLLTLKTNNL